MNDKEEKFEKEFNKLQDVYRRKFKKDYPTYPRYSWEDLCNSIKECIDKNSPWTAEHGSFY